MQLEPPSASCLGAWARVLRPAGVWPGTAVAFGSRQRAAKPGGRLQTGVCHKGSVGGRPALLCGASLLPGRPAGQGTCARPAFPPGPPTGAWQPLLVCPEGLAHEGVAPAPSPGLPPQDSQRCLFFPCSLFSEHKQDL